MKKNVLLVTPTDDKPSCKEVKLSQAHLSAEYMKFIYLNHAVKHQA